MGRTPAKIEHGVRCCASANIDKCTGCPYAGLHVGIGCKTILLRDVQDYLKEIRRSAARIEAMTKQLESAQPKWISVEDELPRDNQIVLACGPKGGMKVVRFCRCGSYNDWKFIGTGKYTEPKWWMPLPEAPKEEI